MTEDTRTPCNDCEQKGSGCGPTCSCGKEHTEHVEQKTVEEHLESIARAEREERVLTMDEARAQVCRSLALMLTKSIADTEAELKKAKDAGQNGIPEETGRRIVAAARELGVQLINTARKLDRPRILRPERSLKIVRPS
jgi:hypothetical protein